MSLSNPFRAAGTYVGEAYVERQADRSLCASIENNQRFPYILAPRQSGKSSLIANVRNSLSRIKYRTVFIDFSTFDPKLLRDYDAFLTTFFNECVNDLKITSPVTLENGSFSSGLAAILSNFHERIVIFLDEIDFLIRADPDFKNRFFSTLRGIFNKRANDSEFSRIQFVLAGAASIDALIDDPSKSPFNVGQAIVLENFTREEVERICSYLGRLGVLFDSSISKRIFYYANGSIYLTQLILEQLWYQSIDKKGKRLLQSDIDQLVNKVIEEANQNIHFLNIFEQCQKKEVYHNISRFLDGQHVLNGGSRNPLQHLGIFGELDRFQNRIYERVFGNGVPLDLVKLMLATGPRNLTKYRQRLIIMWSQPRYALDKRFTQLTLLVDRGEDAQRLRWKSLQQFQDLRDVLVAMPDYPALVVLGPPGCGKSTLLRRLEWDLAVDALRDPANRSYPLTFFVSLNQYKPVRMGAKLPAPAEWLAECWQKRFPDMPPFTELLDDHHCILLLDAINEIPQSGQDAIELWKNFLLEIVRHHPRSRLIFSCRSLDYSSTLSTRELPVPHVHIETLSDAQVQHFLQVYSEFGDTLWKHLQGTPQLDLYRTPIYLRMLVAQADDQGRIPSGQAALFTGFVRQALHREVNGGNSRFQPDALLTRFDCERLTQHRWKDAYDLPTKSVLFRKLAVLAHRMQQQQRTADGDASQVRIDYDKAIAILDDVHAEDILHAGVDLGVLHIDVDNVLYTHQLLQEYFAARYLAVAPDAEWVRTEWRAGYVQPSLEQVLARLADYEPLPRLPMTGWERTMRLAAVMTAQPDAFVMALMETHLPLAGQCVTQAEVRISETVKMQIRWALIERTQNPTADLRARIAAGLALGELSDPRFTRACRPEGHEYLLLPLIEIAGGNYPRGSNDGLYEDKTPVHTVDVAGFALGRFPVTNLEWKCFMEAGGYGDERWWDTELAKAWRSGESTSEGAKQANREFRKTLQNNFDQIRSAFQAGRITSKQAEEWDQVARMSDDEFEVLLNEQYPPGRHTQPSYWNDDAYNNPAQPVIGISWYEARAYCVWLSAQTGLEFRLPTEAEWEVAARGKLGRRYAYGDEFQSMRCNTFESHIRRTTPVGVFPGGETPEGLVDMTGNVWEWTSTLYKPYPYDLADGHEEASAEGRRVSRGGSWNNTRVEARAACRLIKPPDFRSDSLGFRLARLLPC